jgi:hypothetical protein
MKRLLLLLLVLSMFVIAAGPIKLVRLTIINKSGYEASVSLVEKYAPAWYTEANGSYSKLYQAPYYFLPIALGNREFPNTSKWTLFPTIYDATITYLHDGLTVYAYTEELTLAGITKLVLLPPERSGNQLCYDQYKDDHARLNDCLDGLYTIRYYGDHMFKFLPTFWLSRLTP